MKKLIRLLNNTIKEFKHDRRIKKLAATTEKLRNEKQSDYERWRKSEQLFEDWNERTILLATMINPGAKVIEFGAGNMAIKQALPSYCSYTASDIVKRDKQTLVCDLNDKIPFDLSKYDTAIFSGVLEYVFDIDKVFKQFPESLKNVVLSYSCSDISNENRLKNGWLSDYKKNDLENIFESHHYSISEYKEWRNQSIFSLEKHIKNSQL